jgi:hypothetical protein
MSVHLTQRAPRANVPQHASRSPRASKFTLKHAKHGEPSVTIRGYAKNGRDRCGWNSTLDAWWQHVMEDTHLSVRTNDDHAPGSAAAEIAIASSAKKVRGTFLLSRELLDELRDAGYWSRETLARIAERALRAELLRMRAAHNGGEPFTRRPAA